MTSGRLSRHLRGLPASERFNLGTHLGGAAVAAVGAAWLVGRAESALAAFAFATYGVSLVVLLLASALHHAVPPAPGRREALRRLDHVSIYLLIMGTYAPPSLLLLPPAWGVPLLAVVWTLGFAGIALKVLRPFASRWTTIALYVALGWAAVFAAYPMVERTSGGGLALLLGGGVVYTGGAFVYARKRPDPWPSHVGFHGLWHVLVLVAAALHFAFVALYVPRV